MASRTRRGGGVTAPASPKQEKCGAITRYGVSSPRMNDSVDSRPRSGKKPARAAQRLNLPAGRSQQPLLI
jgi:hypothetical protein